MGPDAATPPAERAARTRPAAALGRMRGRTGWLLPDVIAIACCVALAVKGLT